MLLSLESAHRLVTISGEGSGIRIPNLANLSLMRRSDMEREVVGGRVAALMASPTSLHKQINQQEIKSEREGKEGRGESVEGRGERGEGRVSG